MEKKTYEKPVLHAERFTPNEYVAVCWLVACAYDAANTYEMNHYSTTENGWGGRGEKSYKTWYQLGCTHDQAHCGTSTNQVIYDDDNNGVADRMIEVGTDGLGDLECSIYSDADYTTPLAVSAVTKGMYIYWTTASDSDGNDKVWHHQGQVLQSNDLRPNMS